MEAVWMTARRTNFTKRSLLPDLEIQRQAFGWPWEDGLSMITSKTEMIFKSSQGHSTDEIYSTIFQPVFGQIASSGVFRSQFAENLVAFMSEYGFDGVDIDWEYPGAGDRGGTKNDYDNFPLLLKAIRQAFNDHGHGRWGISITAPSSYWYLQWFNLGELVKHVNFINLMSYDLHGIWDQNNEIGKQVLAHTNLTEVDHALELFWRNNVDPKMINLGVAFYGRSYKLADAACRLPGCRFSGPGDKGECSNTEGYLSYREIMDKIKQAGDSAEEIWDEVAAVKMLVYDSNNCQSPFTLLHQLALCLHRITDHVCLRQGSHTMTAPHFNRK